jgi:hypothetical protein
VSTATPDPILFIDAQIYLDLFRVAETGELLSVLEQQQQYIFVTQQIVDEVERNKLGEAKTFLDQYWRMPARCKFTIPPVFGMEATALAALQTDLKEINKAIGRAEKTIAELVSATLERISNSTDAMSKFLYAIFTNAVEARDEERQAAERRRLFGNPPGKAKQAVGDQLNWEQLLRRVRKESSVWIVSRDSDFTTQHGDKRLLNSFLRRELGRAQISCFESLSDAVKSFAEATGAGRQELPSPKRLEEIKKAEEESHVIAPLLSSWEPVYLRAAGYPARHRPSFFPLVNLEDNWNNNAGFLARQTASEALTGVVQASPATDSLSDTKRP